MKKAGSHRELNPELLACATSALPLSYDNWTTTNPHNPLYICTAQVALKYLSHTPKHIKVRLCDHGATYSSTTHGTLCEVNCTRLKQSEILTEFSNHPLPTLNLLELYHPPSLLDCPEWANGVRTYTVLQLYFC